MPRDNNEPWSSISPARQAEILNEEIDDPPVFVGSGGIVLPRIVSSVDPRAFAGACICPGGYMLGNRVTIPQSGRLRDLAVCLINSASITHLTLAIYSTAAIRQRLWTSGSQPKAGNLWAIYGDPDMAVDEGDQYDFCVTVSPTGDGASFAGHQTQAFAVGQLPAGYEMDQAGAPYLMWYVDIAGAAPPSSVNEATIASYNAAPGIIGRIDV